MVSAGIKIEPDLILSLFRENKEPLHLSTIEWLLDRGIDVNFQNSSKETALSIAVRKNRLDWVNFLLAKKANTELAAEFDGTPLLIACCFGYLEIVHSLVQAKASPYVIDRHGENALENARRNQHLPILKFFSQEGIASDRDLLDMALRTPSLTKQLLEWLMTKPIPIEPNDEGFRNLLNFLTYNHDKNDNDKIVRSLLKYGVLPNDENLYTALLRDGFDLAKAFLETGMAISEATIIKAFELPNKSISFLVDAGISIDHRDVNGYTALLRAIRNNDSNRIKSFLKLGASLEITNKKGQTPLILATQMGNYYLVRLLLQHGAHLDAVDHEQKTALMWAQQNKHHHIETLLRIWQRPRPEPTGNPPTN